MPNDAFLADDNLGIRGEVRKVTAGESSWLVFEFQSPTIPRRPPVLVFHSSNRENVFETVDYPRNWRTLTDAELLAIARLE
jgi:hypothetical protein